MAESGGLSGMPSDGVGRRRVALVAAIAVALLAAATIGAWAVFFRGAPASDRPKSPDRPEYEHAQETSSQMSESSAVASQSAVTGTQTAAPGTTATGGASAQTSTAGGSTTAAQPSTTVPAPNRKPGIAYRLGSDLVVAREDGSSAQTVAESSSGVFSLSPDMRMLAYVDFSAGKLVLVDIAGERSKTVGTAAQVTPVWAPDSTAVYFVRDASGHKLEVWQVAKSGTGARRLASGSDVAVSPDGRTVAVGGGTTPASGSPSVQLLRGAKLWKTLDAPGSVIDVALATDRVYVAVAPGQVSVSGEQSEGIWSLPLTVDATSSKLVAQPSSPDRASFGALRLSPDGARLAYVRAGDDGYSRMSIVKTAGGAPATVSSRRDCYPLEWSVDSSAIYLIEGNAWQGEATALARLKADGSARDVIVEGATR